MRFLRKVSSIAPIAIALLLLTALPATAASPPPPSLVGERLDSGHAPNVYTLACNADGSGTVSWQVSGTATGPYPGTFTETGSVTVGPGYDDLGPTRNAVTSAQASFVITSPVGTVRGSKSLNPVDVYYAPLGTCQRPFSNGYPALISLFQTTVRYEATITTADSVYAETGLGTLTGFAVTYLPDAHISVDYGQVSETFETTTNGPVFVALTTPTSVDQCKKDTYKQYLIFKNQGDCVAFIQTAGSNEPGQNIPGS